MKNSQSKLIGPTGEWILFAGAPIAVTAFLFTHFNRSIEHVFGEKLLPFALFFTPVILCSLGRILYPYLPKRVAVPLGVIGWVVAFAILARFYWFGPGAFGHH